MDLHHFPQNQNHPSSCELYVDFYKYRKKYPGDVLLIGTYEIAKGKQHMYVFLKKGVEEKEEKWYETCFKATNQQPITIPYHRLIRVKGCGFLNDLELRYKNDPTLLPSCRFYTSVRKSLCESDDYRDRYAYYITEYHWKYIKVLDGKRFLNGDDDGGSSFQYLKFIINSLREYDTTGGGLTERDIEYVPQHPIELIKRDKNGVIVSGMESVIEAYYMREIAILTVSPLICVSEEMRRERHIVCYVTNEEKGNLTFDDCNNRILRMGWIHDRVERVKESDVLIIKCDDFINNLIYSGKITFNIPFGYQYIYSCRQNFKVIQPVYLCQCFKWGPHVCILNRIHHKNKKGGLECVCL